MALQQINWLQIDTTNVPTGSTIDLGKIDGPLNAIYAKEVYCDGLLICDILTGITGNTGLFVQTGSFYATTNDLQITGSLLITGSLIVSGQTISGLFLGDGAGLYNIPASGVTGLNLSRISDGAVTASISETDGFRVNTNAIITGSLHVLGNLTAEQIIISSSVSYFTQSFYSGSSNFGDTSNDIHTFTGSVYMTDLNSVTDLNISTSGNNVNILGSNFNVPNGGISTGFNVEASGFVTASAFYGDGSGLTNIGSIENIFYVTEEGDDTNDGKTLTTAFRKIKKACEAAAEIISLNPGFPPFKVSIHVKSGYYIEDAPITVPSNTSILGDDLRSVVVRVSESTKHENLFLVNNATYFWGLRLEGCVIDDLENPRKGFFFAFSPNAYITTSPYIQNCTAINTQADKFYAPLDFDNANPLVGNGPGGLIVDDSVLNGYSPLRSMIVDAYTQVSFNGIGICLRGRGYAQLVSFFTNFSRVGVFAIDGGHASLLNSNTTFGDYGLRSKGSRILVKPPISGTTGSTIDVSGSLLIKSEKNNIRNYMISQLQISGSYRESYNDTSSSIYQSTITDSGLLIDAISDDLLSLKGARTIQFTQGLFKGQDITTSSLYTLPAPSTGFTKGAITVFPLISNSSGSLAEDFILSYEYIKDYIVNDPENRFTTLSGVTKTRVSNLLDVPIDTIQRVVVDNAGDDLLEEFGSLITSTSHDFSYAGSGVNFLALPANQGGIGETNKDLRVYEEDGGRVYHTSGDETGDYYSGNDFVIKQATGTIEGRTFYKAISSVITPINLALESI